MEQGRTESHYSNTPALHAFIPPLDLTGKTALPKPLTGAAIAVDLKDIKAIIDLMKENDLSVFEMEKEGLKIRLQKEATPNGQPILTTPIALTPPVALSAGGATVPAAAPGAKPADTTGLKDIVSPMVGTFYRSPSPDAPPFVEVGKKVTPDTVVGIIEAMKVMNEIKAEISGEIAEMVAESGKPVQFGQVLFRVR